MKNLIPDGRTDKPDLGKVSQSEDEKAKSEPVDSSEVPHEEDHLDLSRLRLPQDYTETLDVQKVLLNVPVCKPDRQWFIRVHPDESFRLNTAVLELKEDGETYLIDKPLWNELMDEIIPKTLFTAINRQGVTFLWPIRLPDEDGRLDEWNRSAFEAARLAMKGWVRVASNRSLGAYQARSAPGELAAPQWTDKTFEELLNIAFKDRFIKSMDDPVIRKLQGEV